jgi:hypothetical protein
MGKEETQGSNMFSGMDFASLEEGLGLRLPGSGEPSKIDVEGKEATLKKSDSIIDLSTKIQIPETEEERQKIEEPTAETKEKEEKGEEKEKETGEEDVLITEDSPLYLHAATLHEEGILPTLDLESLKGKTFKDALQIYLDSQKKYIESGKDEFKNSLSERQKQYLELIEKGIPEEQAEHQFNIEDSYGKIIDELLSDDAELQEQLIINNLKLKGVSEKQIQALIKTSKEDERLFEDAKDARDDINSYIANQRKEMLKKVEEEERTAIERDKELQKSIKSVIDSTEEILPGIKISATEKTKLYDLMTKPVEVRTINGQKVPINLINKIRSEDKVLFDLRLNYFIEQGMFKKEFDLSKLNKKLTSSAAAKLSNKLKEEIGGPSGKGLTIEKKAEKDKDNKPKIIFPQF